MSTLWAACPKSPNQRKEEGANQGLTSQNSIGGMIGSAPDHQTPGQLEKTEFVDEDHSLQPVCCALCCFTQGPATTVRTSFATHLLGMFVPVQGGWT